MARDDDDDAVSEEPLPKGRKDRDDEDDDDRPRKKRDDEDEDDDRPRKKSARDEKDDRSAKEVKPMPVQLVGAIMASFALGFLTLYFGCLQTSTAIAVEVQLQKMRRQFEEQDRKMREQFKGMPGMNIPAADRQDPGSGQRYTKLGAHIFMLLVSTLLVVGASLLLMRKAFAKFIVIGAAVAMIFVDFAAYVICLIVDKSDFMDKVLAHHSFCINMTFGLLVGGIVAFLLFNKDVSKALK